MIKLRLLVEAFNHSSYEDDYKRFLLEIARGIRSGHRLKFPYIPRELFISAWSEYGKYGHMNEEKLTKIWELMIEAIIKIIIVSRDVYGQKKIPEDFLKIESMYSYAPSICWPELTNELERTLQKGYGVKNTDQLVMVIDKIMTLSHADWPLACSFIEGNWDTLDKIRDFAAKGIQIHGNISEKKYE